MRKNAQFRLPLETQKDGRKYALKVLQHLAKANTDETQICPVNPFGDESDRFNEPTRYRSGPQWPGFANDVLHLFDNGTREAKLGFLAILTDSLGGQEPPVRLSYYVMLERRGLCQDFGKQGSEVPVSGTASWGDIERLTGWKPTLEGNHAAG